jgi:hypothetical protein
VRPRHLEQQDTSVNSGSLDPHSVRAWAADITAHLRSVLSAFDTYYPFPPGANEVILAGPGGSSLDALRTRPGIASDLISFHTVIHEVIMSDIGNGIFIHAPDDVIAQLADAPALFDDGSTGTIFASNGGGVLYAIDGDNTVHRSPDSSTDSGFAPFATDLRGFLGQVLDAVAHFAATRSPGDV